MRPETTLFMLMSLDGKISTGDNDSMDVDKDFPNIAGVSEGLFQYYDIEQTTDLFSLNSGRVLAKIGINERTEEPVKTPVSFVVIDNSHLKESGINYLAKKLEKLFVITTNNSHTAKNLNLDNVEIIEYENEIDFVGLFEKLSTDYNIEKLTIQTGGTLNSLLLRQGLIDHLSIVIAPCLIGGHTTASLIDGESLHTKEDLLKVKTLKFITCDVLVGSYINLKYDVLN